MSILFSASTPGATVRPELSHQQVAQVQQNIQNTLQPKQPTWEQRIAPMVAKVSQQKAAEAQAALVAQQQAAEAAAEAAQQQQEVAASSEVQTPQPVATAAPSSVTGILAAIRHCESTDNYTAQNPSSTASGAYQFLDSTWHGYGGYARAMDAPASVQDAYAEQVYGEQGSTPWAASEGCWG